MGDEARPRRRGAPLIRTGTSAPGKALLCGEYAVLDGAPAVVAAVNRRVVATWSDEARSMPPEVVATLERARAKCGHVPGVLHVDVSQLQHDRVKLGLGSSAAAAVAAAGAVFATHGHDLSDLRVKNEVFACACDGHATVAPQGSGVDIAASTFGGFLRFARLGDDVELEALTPPADLAIRLVWTGRAARTSSLVAKVRELQERDRHGYAKVMGRLQALASEFANAFAGRNADEVVRAGASYFDAMDALGKAAGAPIVEGRLAEASRVATRFSGSAKPCGAGGGDVAIAFFADAEAARRFELACEGEGLHPIEVVWGASGVETR